jgi:DNA repair protein RadC
MTVRDELLVDGAEIVSQITLLAIILLNLTMPLKLIPLTSYIICNI